MAEGPFHINYSISVEGLAELKAKLQVMAQQAAETHEDKLLIHGPQMQGLTASNIIYDEISGFAFKPAKPSPLQHLLIEKGKFQPLETYKAHASGTFSDDILKILTSGMATHESLKQVALAFEGIDTISAEGHGAAHGAEAIEHHLHQMHVKTPGGAIFYHLPIGSLIVKHPGHLAAEHGPARTIQAGAHHFDAPASAEVHVAKHVDLSSETAVAAADKHIVLKSPKGDVRHAHISAASGSVQDYGDLSHEPAASKALADNLKSHYKQLPAAEAKKPVTFDGKAAAWVPHDWEVYKGPGAEANLGGKFAKDPQGKWHVITKNGSIKDGPLGGDSWIKKGMLVPDDAGSASAAHIEPLKTGAAKVDVGGVAVTKDEIHSAISILSQDKSTAVKQPLKAKGHPLQAMDYHGVSKAELAKHPELKVSKGSKQAHVGQVKLAVLHHLAVKSKEFPQSDAETQVAQQAQDKTQAQAKHAQALTAATAEIGGVAASKEDIEAAIQHLKGTNATAIKQTLKAKGNPLSGSDYWAVVKAYQAAHPNTTKGMKAKPVYIKHLEDTLASLGKTDAESGHNDADQLHQVVTKSPSPTLAEWSQLGLLEDQKANALNLAAKSGSTVYVTKPAGAKFTWKMSAHKPVDEDAHYFEVTPEHQVIEHSPLGPAPQKTSATLAEAKAGLPGKAEPPVAAPPTAPPAPPKQVIVPPKEPEKVAPQVKADPDAQALHDHMLKVAEQPKPGIQPKPAQPLLYALQQAQASGHSTYVRKIGTGWAFASFKPPEGSFGAKGVPFFEAAPDYKVIMHDSAGNTAEVSPAKVLQSVQSVLTHAAPAEPEEVKAPAEAPKEAPKLQVPPGAPVKLLDSPPAGPEEAKAAPEGQMFVTAGGKQSTIPEGSKVWHEAKYLTEDAPTKYAEDPSGKAWRIDASGANGTYALPYGIKDNPAWKLDSGEASTPEQKAAQDLITKAGSGTIDPESEAKSANSYGLAKALKAAAGQSDRHAWARKTDAGLWLTSGHTPQDAAEYYHVHAVPGALKVEHMVAGQGKQDVPLSEVQDAVGQHLTPNSVILHNKQFKHGLYYKPKGKGYVEVKSPTSKYGYNSPNKYGSGAHATYIWHSPSGATKQISPSAASTQLESATEYSTEPKEFGAVAAKSGPKLLGYASVPKPGSSFQTWSDKYQGPSPDAAWEIKPDGTHVLSSGGVAQALSPEALTPALKGGVLLDMHGNTVVKPGIEPQAFHVLAAPGVSREELTSTLAAMDEHAGYGSMVANALKAIAPEITTPGTAQNTAFKSFMNEKAIDGVNQSTAIRGLIREMLQVPQGQEGDFKTPEASYLKGLPQGITGPKDVFKWTDSGLAAPYSKNLSLIKSGTTFYPLSKFGSPELADKIKSVSAEFGNGKVVGTHVSSLSKDQRVKWLESWRKGDMATVFALDAAGGKVSPAHPGAPANAETHQITWSPWESMQVPAAKDIEGNWSDPSKVTLPKAEIANYLIKSGIQHPEFLSDAERRVFVTAHREHNQEFVDHLTRVSQDRLDQGYSPISSVPTWTDNLQPAKAYDTFVEEKTPPGNWTMEASTSYAEDHWDKLAPFDTAGHGKAYYVSNYWAAEPLIQKYMDAEHEKEVQEKSKPVWSYTPGAQAPQSTNPIHQLTRTIPLTGDQSQWFFKPQAKQFRSEVEHAANTLGKLWGFKTPDSELINHDGMHGQAQRKLDAIGDMTHGEHLGFYDLPKIDWGGLSQREVSDIAREHVLDWALGNDDSRASNLLRMQDGSVVGIDKGRAWRNIGTDQDWDGLDGGKGMNSNCAVVYSGLYDAIRDHSLPQEVADKAYIDAIQRARRMQRLPDDRLHEIVKQGIANRPHTDNPDAFAQQVVDRKNSLATDFQGMWGKIYKDAGWKLPEVPSNALPTTHDGTQLHAGFSEPEFMDHVVSTKSHGTPAFFGGRSLLDNHMLVWHEYSGKGTDSPAVRGEGFLHPQALKAAELWAENHKTEGPLNHGIEGSQDKLALPGSHGYYNSIISAAKTVSHHVTDKEFNQDKLSAMEATKQHLSSGLQDAEAAIAAGPESPKYASTSASLGHPMAYAEMAKEYLTHIATVEDGKENSVKFKAGDLPEWSPSASLKSAVKAQEAASKAKEPPAPVNPVKVALKTYTRASSPDSLFDKQGELHVGSQWGQTSTPAKAWHVQLPTGEEIVVHPGASSTISHQGRISFSAVPEDGSASLERIRDQLQSMGVPLPEAQEHDLELHYWRHLASIANDREGGDEGKYAKVWDTLGKQASTHGVNWDDHGSTARQRSLDKLADAGLSPEDELGIWHSAWGHVTSPEQVKSFADSGGHLPRLGHYDLHSPEAGNGRPYWMRFDYTPEQVSKMTMPTITSQNAATSAEKMTRTGGRFSTEARLRVLGSNYSGMSSSSDMKRGSSDFVFTRLNQEDEGPQTVHVLLSPALLARTDTYSYNSDHFGEPQYKASESPFDLSKLKYKSAGGNETMIRDAVPLLDHIELMYAPAAKRTMLIHELKELGITHIRGVPVEKRIVTSITPDKVAEIRSGLAENMVW